MSNIAISVENLSKSYFIGHNTAKKGLHPDMREVLARNARNLARKTRDFIAGRSLIQGDAVEEFWALRDVSFEIKCGERLGIIGRNGAGKSTLLKILSRITEPSKGRVQITGRVASLLEVGTGFHSELTGRENIFLNGAILGMSRSEIQRKFDEIVDFAEIERFLDTPVKRYSSGMYMRLAFAVAAHLEPDILIVDEVLAVGDAQFQKKCLTKMDEIGSEGRTVIFVSHNLTAIRNICSSMIWLQNGRIYQAGSSIEIGDSYLRHNFAQSSPNQIQSTIALLPQDPVFKLETVTLRQRGELCTTILNGSPVELEIGFTVHERTIGLRVYFDLCDEDRNILIRTFNDETVDSVPVVEPGRYISRAVIPADLLAPRTYELRVYGTIYNIRNIPANGIGISLVVQKSNNINRAYPQEPIRAKLLPVIPWETRPA
jgi:lipopolysaccharide transport system ATP-binding protein